MSRVPVARLLCILLPVVCVALFGRDYYTPDEPREASLVVAMAAQPAKALPELAGRPFAEKPPLLYWLGAATVSALGATPGAARVPNLAYALATILALAWIATRAAGPAAGFASGVVAATSLQLYAIEAWLATDAPLVAGVAVALAGLYAAFTASARRGRFLGYGVFHVGLLVAFFAKGFAGWMVPVFAFLTVVLTERRWRELVAVELWAGVPLLAAAIGAWVAAVAALPSGREALTVLFWYNLVGRAVPLPSPGEFAYATGHQNSPGKYLIELPLYLLPWTPLAYAALRRVPRRWREQGGLATATRLALGAIVPATGLLSVAATARGVYYGPPLLGFALLIGLYAGGAGAAVDRTERICWRLTGWLVALVALVVAGLAALAAFAPAATDATSLVLGALALAAGGLAAALGVRLPVASAAAMPRLAVAVALVFSVALGALYRPLNEWESLEAVAARIRDAAGDAPLIVLDADETTLALATLYLPAATRAAVVAAGEPGGPGRAAAAFAAAAGAARIVWQVPTRRQWDLAAWRGFLGYGGTRPVPPPPRALPAGFGALKVECFIERAGGRDYAVLAAADAARAPGARCR